MLSFHYVIKMIKRKEEIRNWNPTVSVRFNLQLHPAKRTKKKDYGTDSWKGRRMTRTRTALLGRADTSRVEPEVATVARTPALRHGTRTTQPVHRPSPRLSLTRTNTRGSRHPARICCSKRVICRGRNPGAGTPTPARLPRPPRANRRLIPPQVEV